jgi:ribulose-5-phosphate 4-epimerase/fuculose-1-phosphate aldolase
MDTNRFEFWFATGSQNLYGPETLAQVERDSQDLVRGRAPGCPTPSSDTKRHRVLYRSFSGIRGVCHTHSTYSVAWTRPARPSPASARPTRTRRREPYPAPR